jgi:cell division protein FtsL
MWRRRNNISMGINEDISRLENENNDLKSEIAELRREIP